MYWKSKPGSIARLNEEDWRNDDYFEEAGVDLEEVLDMSSNDEDEIVDQNDHDEVIVEEDENNEVIQVEDLGQDVMVGGQVVLLPEHDDLPEVQIMHRGDENEVEHEEHVQQIVGHPQEVNLTDKQELKYGAFLPYHEVEVMDDDSSSESEIASIHSEDENDVGVNNAEAFVENSEEEMDIEYPRQRETVICPEFLSDQLEQKSDENQMANEQEELPLEDEFPSSQDKEPQEVDVADTQQQLPNVKEVPVDEESPIEIEEKFELEQKQQDEQILEVQEQHEVEQGELRHQDEQKEPEHDGDDDIWISDDCSSLDPRTEVITSVNALVQSEKNQTNEVGDQRYEKPSKNQDDQQDISARGSSSEHALLSPRNKGDQQKEPDAFIFSFKSGNWIKTNAEVDEMIDLMPDKPKKGRKRTSKGAMVPGKEFRTMSQTPSLASSSPVKKKRKCRFLKSKPSEKQNVSLTSVNLETEMSEDGTSTEANSLPEVGNEKETGPQKLRIVQIQPKPSRFDPNKFYIIKK